MNSKLFFIIIIIFCSAKVYALEELPKPLNEKDKNLYIKIFTLQKEGNFKKSEELISKLENNLLLGRVKAQKYLHPTGYISKFLELKQWLDHYS
ncbi:MAG: lytic murein transglycosylase, partial [SAR116 cluster bacterium]|nr:lytic murein transglycosylase [SAR116 cluster bacterium]